MKIDQLINRAFMQVGDTSQTTYTPYQFLEFYNEGNQILHPLAGLYLPYVVQKVFSDRITLNDGITLPESIVIIVKFLMDKKEVEEYTIDGISHISLLSDDEEHDISIEYIPSTGYKLREDESGYPSELESMLVRYMVARALNIDISFTQMWAGQLSELARNVNGNSFIGRGYYNYDRRRIDYTD